MTVSVFEPATDWTGQTYEERLRLCAETLFVHGLIKDRTHNHVTAQIRTRSEIQRVTSPGEFRRILIAVEAAAPANDVRRQPLRTFIAQAAEIVDSEPVISIFAAPEWDELGDDGRLWIAGIVREATARALQGEER